MRDIWVISDTHFGHQNIIGYCNRPYRNYLLMDKDIVERWNSVVKPDDIVYHLGDVYMQCSKDYIENTLGRLNGRKRLILGNHDNGKDQILQRYFQKIMMWRMFPEFNILLTHVPVHESSLRETMVNVHGHIHDKPSPKGPYKCVCVEQINYIPINIEDLRVK